MRNLKWFCQSGGFDESSSTYCFMMMLTKLSDPITSTFTGNGGLALVLQLRKQIIKIIASFVSRVDFTISEACS